MSTDCLQQNIIYIIRKSRCCLIIILIWVLTLTVLTILASVAVLMIILKVFRTNRNVMTAFAFFTTVILGSFRNDMRVIKAYETLAIFEN